MKLSELIAQLELLRDGNYGELEVMFEDYKGRYSDVERAYLSNYQSDLDARDGGRNVILLDSREGRK